MKEQGYEGLVAKDEESVYRGGHTRSWLKVKIRREGRFIVGGILGLPHTFVGILGGQRVGRRLVYRGAVEWRIGRRTALKSCSSVVVNAASRLSTISGSLVG